MILRKLVIALVAVTLAACNPLPVQSVSAYEATDHLPPPMPVSVCITAAEYIKMRYEDFHGQPIPAPGDIPNVREIEGWRFDQPDSYYFVEQAKLPFLADRFSFYASADPATETVPGKPFNGKKTVIIAAFFSGCFVAAIEVPSDVAASLVLNVKNRKPIGNVS